MSGQNETETETETRYQEIIRKLEETLQATRNELSYMASIFTDERQQHARIHDYANMLEEENTYLKQKIKDFEREAEQSQTQTQERTYYSSYSDAYSYSSPISPVSVSVSPRIHPQPQPQPQPYQCSPAMATCDGLFEPSPSHLRTNNQ
jgi:septal ring factor EnvC (AmiA/AmiB activator)